MQECYQEIIATVSAAIAQSFLSNEESLPKRSIFLDADVAEITRQIGLKTTLIIFEETLENCVKEKQSKGLVIQRKPTIQYNVIFGLIEMKSPYLWAPGNNAKPLTDEMGITHRGRSETVNRALTDFGIEESFGHASERFAEHYKYNIGPSAVSRVTKQIAQEALEYNETILADAGQEYGVTDDDKELIGPLLIELDGCVIRTAVFSPIENTEETSPIMNLPKKGKTVNWRDVRIGLTRPLGVASKTYVGMMSSYPEVVGQLFDASVMVGMTSDTKVIGVSDGGIGLKEELEKQFSNLQFILDKTHLKDHLYETAKALGIPKKERQEWVSSRLKNISEGEVGRIKEELEQEHESEPNHRLKRLIGYLTRFYNALNYDEFKKKGYPIGSGEIESAHKSVPQKRLKLPGASWHPNSVNPMPALRVLRADDWWEDFWNERTERKLAA